MKNYKTKLMTLVIFLVAFTTQSQAQLTKGAYILSFDNNINYIHLESESPSSVLQVTYLKLLGNRMMLGADLFYQQNYSRTHAIPFVTDVPFRTYVFTPTIRYYLSTGKLASFFSVENRIQRTKFDNSGLAFPIFENTSGFQTAMGIGANYFLSNRVAIEMKAATNVINSGDFKDDPRYIAIDLGLRVFFNPNLRTVVDSLPSKVLKKGNTIAYARFNFNSQLKKNNSFTTFSYDVNLSQFILDKFYIKGSINTPGNPYRDLFDRFNIGMGISLGYYFNLGNAFYLSPSIGYNVLSKHSKISKFLDNQPRIKSIPISLTASYFVKQKRIYLGARYDRIKDQQDVVYLTSGIDYYVVDNVYFRANLNWNISKYVYSFDRYSWETFTFGVGYLFN